MNIVPIGFVRNEITYPHYHEWGGVVSEIVVNEEYANGLIGLEDFSHAIIVFYLHKATYNEERHLVRHPQEREDLPKIGIFAQRARHRPNPIRITTVPILEREGNILKVKGLDAINEIPVLDIKPYFPDFDLRENARVKHAEFRFHASSGIPGHWQ